MFGWLLSLKNSMKKLNRPRCSTALCQKAGFHLMEIKQLLIGRPPLVPEGGITVCSSPKPSITAYDCKLISEEYLTHQEAKEKEKSIYDHKKNKLDLTTDVDSSDDERNCHQSFNEPDLNDEASKLMMNSETESKNIEDLESEGNANKCG